MFGPLRRQARADGSRNRLDGLAMCADDQGISARTAPPFGTGERADPADLALRAFLHDLNQPLTAIRSYAEALERLLDRESGSFETRIREIPAKIVGQAERAAHHITELRDALEQAAGPSDALDLNRAVLAAWRELEPEVQGGAAGADFDLDPSSPRVRISETLLPGLLGTAFLRCASLQTYARNGNISIRTAGTGRLGEGSHQAELLLIAGRGEFAMGRPAIDETLRGALARSLAAWKVVLALNGGSLSLCEAEESGLALRIWLPLAET